MQEKQSIDRAARPPRPAGGESDPYPVFESLRESLCNNPASSATRLAGTHGVRPTSLI